MMRLILKLWCLLLVLHDMTLLARTVIVQATDAGDTTGLDIEPQYDETFSRNMIQRMSHGMKSGERRNTGEIDHERPKRMVPCDPDWNPKLSLHWSRSKRHLVVGYCQSPDRPSSEVCYLGNTMVNNVAMPHNQCVYVKESNCEANFTNVPYGVYNITVMSRCCFDLPSCPAILSGPWKLPGPAMPLVQPGPGSTQGSADDKKPLKNLTADEPHMQTNHTDHPTGKFVLTVSMSIVGSLLTASVLVLLFVIWRRRKRKTSARKKRGNQYHETTNFSQMKPECVEIDDELDQLDPEPMKSCLSESSLALQIDQAETFEAEKQFTADVTSCLPSSELKGRNTNRFLNNPDGLGILAPPHFPKVLYPMPWEQLEEFRIKQQVKTVGKSMEIFRNVASETQEPTNNSDEQTHHLFVTAAHSNVNTNVIPQLSEGEKNFRPAGKKDLRLCLHSSITTLESNQAL